MWDKILAWGSVVFFVWLAWSIATEESPEQRQQRVAREQAKIHNAIVLSCQSQSVTYAQMEACVALSEGKF